jgi:hypothetical protein
MGYQHDINKPKTYERWMLSMSDDDTLSSPRFTGSSALPVLCHCIDPPTNLSRTALRDISPKNHLSHIE